MRCINIEKVKKIDKWFVLICVVVLAFIWGTATTARVARQGFEERRIYLEQLEKILKENNEEIINIRYID